MRSISYDMYLTVCCGAKSLSKEALDAIRHYVVSQRFSGGYKNKAGDRDLYYTLFGVTLSRALNIKYSNAELRNYLSEIEPKRLDLVHLSAYVTLYSLSRLPLCIPIEAMYFIPKTGKKLALWFKENAAEKSYPHKDKLSPYSRFIWTILSQNCGMKNDSASLSSYKSENGFSNIKGGSISTIATAAAIAIGYKGSLSAMQEKDGGFKASPIAPIADLLTTAVALFAMHRGGEKPIYEARNFIEGHWLDGSFSSTIIDNNTDLEYLFYGLLALGSWNS